MDFLGRELALTGTHVRCEHGVCGACTMLYDGLPACPLFAPQANGHEIVTVEGLARTGGGVHPLQEAFAATHTLQWGFCTPGFLITMSASLAETPEPDEAAVREALSGHLCGYTGYHHIVDGVLLAARRIARTR